MDSGYVVVLITAPSIDVGRSIAKKLLESRLVACVNILPQINSLYVWEGKICDDQEALLFCKTRSEVVLPDLIPAVQAIHPYEVPEIIALPIMTGSQNYLDWIGSVVLE